MKGLERWLNYNFCCHLLVTFQSHFSWLNGKAALHNIYNSLYLCVNSSPSLLLDAVLLVAILDARPLSLSIGGTSWQLGKGGVVRKWVCRGTGRENPLLMCVLTPSLACSAKDKHSLSIWEETEILFLKKLKIDIYNCNVMEFTHII